NGAEKFTWPDGGTTPFRGEKGLGWEGGFRAPLLVRWPGRIPAGRVLNGITSLEDIVPTIMAAAGVPDIKERLLEGYQAGDKHFRVHLDGYNQLPYLTGETDDPTEDERFGRVGRQTITDTGPLTRKRMETIEDDLLARSLSFIDRAHQAGKPFLLWHNTTRMHVWTRLSERWRDKTGLGLYADGMQELDWVVGELLAKLDALGIADNTIVVFATDNGAEKFTWPDGGTTPFRGEKGLGWEGGFRAPLVLRWPGKIPAGRVLNGITSLEDIVPTVMAAVGVPDVKERLLEGYQAGDKHFRVHLDGYNQLPYLTGETEESPRHEFYYYGERELYAIRYNNWKVHFQTKDDWFGGTLVRPTVPRPVNLRADPFEQHMDAPAYPLYVGEKLWTVLPAAAIVQQHVASFTEFPPRQAPPGFNPQAMVETVLQTAAQRQGN
ncbi:MAG TPA: sulfatase-like hydrolase/transferase, partial [Actinomycetes bacterium]|nr:sulfatase-like hydrolase/transferase [Actinomycetes bacterium]